MKRSLIKSVSLLVVLVMCVGIALVGCGSAAPAAPAAADKAVAPASASPLLGDGKEEYYMLTFLSGIEYWKGCWKGFQDAAKLYNVKVVYDGGQDYDLNQAVTVLEQVIAKKPAGIAVTCMNPDGYKDAIAKAIASGIQVVTFDADSPDSGRASFLATGNVYAGSMAGKRLAELLKGEGEVAMCSLPGQLNHEQRMQGFKDAIAANPKMKLVQVGTGGDQNKAATAIAAIIQANPNVTGIFCTDAMSGVGAVAAVKEANKVGKISIVSFDTDKGTLDAIKEGVIDSSIAQGTWNMGFWALQDLYQLKHALINPVEGWKEKKIAPLPPYVDTGVSVVTKENVESFYVK